jgi:hypothetical protein
MTATRLQAEDLEWEEPARSRRTGGAIEALCEQVGHMRAALTSRRGAWAVLDIFDAPSRASSVAAALSKRRDVSNDSRLAGLEFAGRRAPDGKSKLYVRAQGAQS